MTETEQMQDLAAQTSRALNQMMAANSLMWMTLTHMLETGKPVTKATYLVALEAVRASPRFEADERPDLPRFDHGLIDQTIDVLRHAAGLADEEHSDVKPKRTLSLIVGGKSDDGDGD